MNFQDLKQTPQKPTPLSRKKNQFDESFTKELLYPFL
jgi:hypothetical protein